jgi:hypothetical protein
MNEIQSIDFYFESNVIIYIGPSNKYTFRVGVGDITGRHSNSVNSGKTVK